MSGFHHAAYDEAFGYCTFNGLIITARALKAAGLVKRIGILDCDVHYGDGTHALISHFGLQDWLKHYTLGFQGYATPECADEFLSSLPTVIDGMRDCDLILYQAGADPHISDPLGGFMTTAQLQYRDELVFLLCQQYGIPIAWNLAGGYQRDADGGIQPVLEIHDNTLMACQIFISFNN